jgi:hypothetical protein
MTMASAAAAKGHGWPANTGQRERRAPGPEQTMTCSPAASASAWACQRPLGASTSTRGRCPGHAGSQSGAQTGVGPVVPMISRTETQSLDPSVA